MFPIILQVHSFHRQNTGFIIQKDEVFSSSQHILIISSMCSYSGHSNVCIPDDHWGSSVDCVACIWFMPRCRQQLFAWRFIPVVSSLVHSVSSLVHSVSALDLVMLNQSWFGNILISSPDMTLQVKVQNCYCGMMCPGFSFVFMWYLFSYSVLLC